MKSRKYFQDNHSLTSNTLYKFYRFTLAGNENLIDFNRSLTYQVISGYINSFEINMNSMLITILLRWTLGFCLVFFNFLTFLLRYIVKNTTRLISFLSSSVCVSSSPNMVKNRKRYGKCNASNKLEAAKKISTFNNDMEAVICRFWMFKDMTKLFCSYSEALKRQSL